jgi:hypothetical protein
MNQMPPPDVLYKYLSADRFDVLVDCKIRFSQRSAFKDDHELQPDYLNFGTHDEIERHVKRTGYANGALAAALAWLIGINPALQRRALDASIKNITSINKMGILCLTETDDSHQMWNEYASHGTGFIVGFDTTHDGFKQLVSPLGIQQVSYSDEEIETFLGMMERFMETKFPEALYRKRVRFSFEREWRGVRLLKDLERYPGEIYLAPFSPACVNKIIMGADCHCEAELHNIVGRDERYRGVEISKV